MFGKSLRKAGVDISRYNNPSSPPLTQKKQILDSYDIDLVLDIGANTGQFARQLRNDIGYTNRMISFEPLKSAPESQYVGKEMIEVKKLDTIFDSFRDSNGNIYMKIDTQGFESKVIRGTKKSLMQIHTIQIEMSLVPLYEEEVLFDEMHKLMTQEGYRLIAMEPGFLDCNDSQLLQFDGIYHRV